MKYLLLIYSNDQSRQLWERMSSEERLPGLQAYEALTAELAAAGELLAAEALADASLAKRVTLHDDRVAIADGPFAELKELVSGFYLVDCESSERAIEIAARIPEASLGLVEVRPVMSLGDFVT